MHNCCHHRHSSTTNLRLAFFLNFGFTIIELIGGLLTNSLAILSDAVHDLGDSIALGVAWWLENASRSAADEQFTFGRRRLSLLAALINSVILIGSSIFIVFHAVPRFFAPVTPHTTGMMALAVLGILVNGAAAFRLRSAQSLNEKVVAWHLFEDVLGWLLILVGAFAMYIGDFPFIDPLLSVLISGFILYNVAKNLKKALRVFLQGVPEGIDLSVIRREVLEIDGVIDLHDLHLWSLDGENHVLTAHVVLEEARRGQQLELKVRIKERLSSLDVHHSTIELEISGENCRVDVQNCLPGDGPVRAHGHHDH